MGKLISPPPPPPPSQSKGMTIHYQNAQGEERFIKDVIHIQNINNEDIEVYCESGKTLNMKWYRVEGVYYQ